MPFFPYLQGAGPAIRPQLSDLVCCMLESLSSLEDQGLNYIEVGLVNLFGMNSIVKVYFSSCMT